MSSKDIFLRCNSVRLFKSLKLVSLISFRGLLSNFIIDIFGKFLNLFLDSVVMLLLLKYKAFMFVFLLIVIEEIWF